MLTLTYCGVATQFPWAKTRSCRRSGSGRSRARRRCAPGRRSACARPPCRPSASGRVPSSQHHCRRRRSSRSAPRRRDESVLAAAFPDREPSPSPSSIPLADAPSWNPVYAHPTASVRVCGWCAPRRSRSARSARSSFSSRPTSPRWSPERPTRSSSMTGERPQTTAIWTRARPSRATRYATRSGHTVAHPAARCATTRAISCSSGTV